MKNFFLFLTAALILLTFASCGESKTVHCDNCSTELAIDADSSMDENWIIYCEPCSEELFTNEDLTNNEILPELTTAE